MRGALFLLSLLAGAAAEEPATRGDQLAEFTSPAPAGVDNVSEWEVVEGKFENTHAAGAYRFYVNPGRQALYQLMRYRVAFRAPLTEEERQNRSTEKLVWNGHPGERVPLLCWERVVATGGAPAYWRELSPGSTEYIWEMRVLIQVLSLHQTARKAEGPGEGDP
ncbi:MAG TPA: hypothetical protein VN461_19050 [Vicinamibacteria bacterium]|jgi:hypothetical protein|nr:hypothetical protein [Vicinamibacteria bacterium]